MTVEIFSPKRIQIMLPEEALRKPGEVYAIEILQADREKTVLRLVLLPNAHVAKES